MGMHDTFGAFHGVSRRTSTATSADEIPREVHWDPSIRLRDMDKAKIDIALIFPSHALSYCTLRDVRFEVALQNAYNRYISEYCKSAEGRLRWAIAGVLRDIDATVEQLTYWAEEDNNCIGVLIPPGFPNSRLLDNPDLHPLLRRAQDLDLPVMVHGGVLRPPYTSGASELDNAGFLIRAVYQPWAGQTAVGALIGGGVFDLFPNLRVGVFETGAGWMPWFVERLDDNFDSRPQMVPFLKRRPSDVIQEGRLFHAIDPLEQHASYAIEQLGEDHWLLGTDYPHAASLPWPKDMDDFVERTDISAGAKRKIPADNAIRFAPRLA